MLAGAASAHAGVSKERTFTAAMPYPVHGHFGPGRGPLAWGLAYESGSEEHACPCDLDGLSGIATFIVDGATVTTSVPLMLAAAALPPHEP